jgi:hypothetical protein
MMAVLIHAALPAESPSPVNPLADKNIFPIAVWLQSPANAVRYKQAGINLYVGLWEGPTDKQLSELKAAGMTVVCEQTRTGLAHKDDPTIVAWMHGDEPDNAQPLPGGKGYGPFIAPTRIVADYERMKKADPSRPVMLNLGQGVANEQWVGRVNGAKLSDYETYVKGGDIVSFDVYPMAGLSDSGKLWYVAKGVGRLMKWTGGQRRVWSCIECTRIGGELKPTPTQVKAEVWMAITHGATGLIYFVHQFKPSFDEHALLDDPEMLAAVTAINRQIQDLAPVFNSPSLPDAVRATTDNVDAPVAALCKKRDGMTYVFAVGMRDAPMRATFALPRTKTATAEVIGENRTVPVRAGRFEDLFTAYGVHIYRIR